MTSFTRKKLQHYSYGLHHTIGKGYSSQVYQGRNDNTSEAVAIKVIDLQMLKNQINKVLLESQIKILKELSSLPHILTLHDIYTTKNNTYIITQLCQSDLSKHVKKGLPQEKACEYMTQIITGYLNFAKKDIIHRDLKPANILLTNENQLKIADFGFAIKVCDAHKRSPLYMAPQSLRRNQYTLKTDIWALGVIFYQLLTGQTPWKAKNQKDLVKKIEACKMDDLIGKLKLGNQSKQFLKQCLRSDKTLRWGVDDIERFTFATKNPPNILGEKKMNEEVRLSLTRPIFTPKRQKSMENRLFIDRSGQYRSVSKALSSRKLSSFKTEANHSVQLKVNLKKSPSVQLQSKKKQSDNTKQNPETTTATVRTGHARNEKKLVSKILISQIHFCRFLFKLLTRIRESSRKGLLEAAQSQAQETTRSYVGIIRHKIQKLVDFSSTNFINCVCYEEYKQTSDYFKLMKITKQYRDRYSAQLKQYWDESQCKFNPQPTLNMISCLQEILQNRQNKQATVNTYQNEIIALDYLITAKQLIEIFKHGENYEKFARKSRIEDIVEGKTAKITMELFRKIMNRALQQMAPHQRSTPTTHETKMAIVG